MDSVALCALALLLAGISTMGPTSSARADVLNLGSGDAHGVADSGRVVFIQSIHANGHRSRPILRRIAKYQPVYDAYEHGLNPDVLQDAMAETGADEDGGVCGLPSPVWGVPTAIKDAMNGAGMETTAGSSYLGTTNLGDGGSPSPGAINLIPSQDCTEVSAAAECQGS